LLVNPHYEKKVAKGLYEALNMADDYKKLRHKANFDYVVKHNALYWISQFLKLLVQSDSSRFNIAPSLSIDELKDAYVEVKNENSELVIVG
jgi:trehalose-6-phosphate synthase